MTMFAWMGMGAIRTVMAAAVAALTLAVASAPAAARAIPFELADLATKLSPAVVNISTTQTVSRDEEVAPDFGPSPFDGGALPQKVQSLGSGFLIDAKGIIVTNNHVVNGADKIDVTLTDGTVLSAKVLGRDSKTDIAVLKVESKTPFAHVALGDSEHLRVGDWVMAIGNPFGLGGSVTLGIISALNRDIHAGNYDDFIQTDAAINRGNSGGPLFNLNGDVVGMNTAIISPSGESVGIGFATPASTIRSIVQQIVTHGEIRRGWIGVRIQSVTPEIATSLGLPDRHGALVAGVSEDGPAAEAGLETGDLITTFDGQPVPEMRDLPRIVAETEIGKRVKVGIIRSGQPRQVKLTVGRLDEPDEDESATGTPPPASAKVSVLGLDLAALSDDVRAQFGIADGVSGALVADLSPSSEAADKGVRPGDIIVRVGQADVTSPEDVRDEVAKEKKAGRKLVLLRILTGNAARFVAVPLE